MKYIISFVFLIVGSNLGAQSDFRIGKVQYQGIKKIKLFYLQRFIQQNTDSIAKGDILQNDLQSLFNTQYFESVSQNLDTVGSTINVSYDLKERVTLLPIIDWGQVDGFNYYKGGFFNYNWLGKGGWLNIWYMYYERHSAGFYAYLPYIGQTNFGWSIGLQNYGTIEPLYFEEGQLFYNYDNRSVENLMVYEFKQNSFFKLGGTFFQEEYLKNPERNDPSLTFGPNHHVFNKYLLKANVSENSLDYYYHYLDGHQIESFLEYVKTINYDNGFVKWVLDYKLFAKIGQKGNFASRCNVGLASNFDSPFAPFVVDNYQNIRGVGNRVSRGTAQFVSNIEYRYTLIQPSWGAIQGVLFSDVGAWRMPGDKIIDSFKKESTQLYMGLGLRVFLNQLFNSIIRIDYATDLRSPNSGWVIGLGQYF